MYFLMLLWVSICRPRLLLDFITTWHIGHSDPMFGIKNRLSV